MHLGNGAITPECVAITISTASAGLGLCAWSEWRSWGRRTSEGETTRNPSLTRRVGLAAGLGAFIFAAQALNVPILSGVGAHLVGGVLLAWALGPAVGGLTMALVLVLQALLLGDGGTLALGANIVNMALLPAGLTWAARRTGLLSSGFLGASARELAVVGVLAAAAVVLSSAAVVAEVWLFRSAGELAGLATFARTMLLVHLPIAAAEGLASAALAAGLAYAARRHGRSAWLRPASLAAVAAVGLSVLAATISSDLPDGYEYASRSSSMVAQVSE